MSDVRCTFCGNPATGFATINDNRYCHGDDDCEPTCYESAQWAMSNPPADLLRGDEIQAFDISGDHETRGDNNPGRQA